MASNPLEAQRNRLAARADRLERELAAVILELDEAAVERLAQVALAIGFTAEEVAAVFGPAFRRNLETVYSIFAEEAAADADLTVADVTAQADAAATRGLAELTDEAQAVVDALLGQALEERWEVDRLARALKRELPLTRRQNEYIANYEKKLREDRRLALRNKLRDRRFDRRLTRPEPLSEAEIRQMVDAYRGRWTAARALTVARQELYRAANATEAATYAQALADGAVPASTRKFWIHQHDAKVRHSHLLIPELNPDGVPLDQPFVTPLGPLRYPLDPEGVAENVIACRCLLVFSASLRPQSA